jgi:hypothetical protein
LVLDLNSGTELWFAGNARLDTKQSACEWIIIPSVGATLAGDVGLLIILATEGEARDLLRRHRNYCFNFTFRVEADDG